MCVYSTKVGDGVYRIEVVDDRNNSIYSVISSTGDHDTNITDWRIS